MTSPGQYRSGQKRWQKAGAAVKGDFETKSSAIAEQRGFPHQLLAGEEIETKERSVWTFALNNLGEDGFERVVTA